MKLILFLLLLAYPVAAADIELVWNHDGVTYVVEQESEVVVPEAPEWITLATVLTPEFTITGLNPDKIYRFRVFAIYPNGFRYLGSNVVTMGFKRVYLEVTDDIGDWEQRERKEIIVAVSPDRSFFRLSFTK